MKDYFPTIGLEIHAELKTRTKMFCDSKNDPDETRPNANVCPVCTGHPGTLPVINKRAVRHVLLVGIALGGAIAKYTEFDRKNYFYPDIPKGYQISQYKYPLVTGGSLSAVAITRIHLEEDTATSLHEGEYSLLDFNRAGVPLMELVTEPVIRSAKEAGDFARELQLLLRYLGVSDANMEKGEMRVEANISVIQDSRLRRSGYGRQARFKIQELGTKVEVKNLNSFRAVERAIEYELKRQREVLEAGEKVIQETRGWDEEKGITVSQRRKEESHDYRYFPDPDLPSLVLSEVPEFREEALRRELPEVPTARRFRYARDFGLKDGDIEILVSDAGLGAFFESVAAILKEKSAVQLAANYVTSDLLGLLKAGKREEGPIRPVAEAFADLIRMVREGEISSRAAKDILVVLVAAGGTPRGIAKEKGLFQESDRRALRVVAEKVIASNPKVVEEYKAGKTAALQFLIGLAMKETKGAGNPKGLRNSLLELLK